MEYVSKLLSHLREMFVNKYWRHYEKIRSRNYYLTYVRCLADYNAHAFTQNVSKLLSHLREMFGKTNYWGGGYARLEITISLT